MFVIFIYRTKPLSGNQILTMKNLYSRFLSLIFYLTVFSQLSASEDTSRVKSTENKDGNGKMCSCQLMQVQTTKESQDQLVAIFAEKTLKGKDLIGYKLMDEFIRREKIYFEIVFVRSVEVKERIRSRSDCLSLYNALKAAHADVQMYNIIDVDVLMTLARR